MPPRFRRGSKRFLSIGVRRLLGATVLLMSVGSCASPEPLELVPTLPPTTTPATSATSTTAASQPTTAPEAPVDDVIVLGEGDDFATVVGAADEGTTFVIETGIHRLHEITPKDGMTFIGRPGSILSGATILHQWVADSPDVWRHEGISMTGLEHGDCIEGYDGCRFTQDLYMDDVMLWQVTSAQDLGPGRWFWDDETILVSDDPAGRRVELSMATYAVMGDADDVTIQGLVVEKYAVPAQFGAIQSSVPGTDAVGTGWLIEDTEVRLNHGAGIRTGEATTLRRVRTHHNGQLGIAGPGGTGGLVEESVIASNNIAGFNSGWEAGGAKFTETVDLVVRNNRVYNNQGPGLWTDINNYGTLYESNTVSNNSGPGIFHEISYDAVIRNNTVTGNGDGWEDWLWGSGILVAASARVEVYGNTVTNNADGIGGIQQDREDGPEGPHLLRDLHVHDNTISVFRGHTGVVEDNGDRDVFESRNNRFEANTYVNVTGRRYMWDDRTLDASGWQEAGQDLEGTWR